MKNTTAIFSMLHEGRERRNSATRLFRGEPVSALDAEAAGEGRQVASAAVLCWEDQLDALSPKPERAFVLAKGPRKPLPEVDAISAARRWSDGWRGGLLSTCDFDLGFYGPWFANWRKMSKRRGVADRSSRRSGRSGGARRTGAITQTRIPRSKSVSCRRPGLGGALLRPRCSIAWQPPKRMADGCCIICPINTAARHLAGDMCAPFPPPSPAPRSGLSSIPIGRSRGSARHESLNGHLISSDAEELVRRAHAWQNVDPLAARSDAGIEHESRFTGRSGGPARIIPIAGPPMKLDMARATFRELVGSG